LVSERNINIKRHELGDQHSGYCRKEAEIAEMHTDIKTLKRIVMGNGQPGLSVTVPELATNVKELNGTIGNLTTGVSGLLKFQENQLGIQQGKSIVRRRNRWIIGVLIGAVIGMAGIIVAIVT